MEIYIYTFTILRQTLGQGEDEDDEDAGDDASHTVDHDPSNKSQLTYARFT